MVPQNNMPKVAFDPLLHLQRQIATHDILKTLASHTRFKGQLRSLLDVGCGDCSFIRRLIPCDDALPLERMTGIDISDDLLNSMLWNSIAPDEYLWTGMGEERWRPLDIDLLHDSFEGLTVSNTGYHDAIVSMEVIEHLDPEPLARFASVLLGTLRPQVCVVTTPNRDFNALFDYLEQLDADATKSPSYYRSGIPYRMRHHDHRFEWNRQEFRDWARQAALEFGYDVEFSGVGGMENGMVFQGAMSVLQQAASACSDPAGYSAGASCWEELKEFVRQTDDVDSSNIIRQTFGDCSQIAVFVIKGEPAPRHCEQLEHMYHDQPSEHHRLDAVCHHSYPFVREEFPPQRNKILEIIMKDRLVQLIPGPTRGVWEGDGRGDFFSEDLGRAILDCGHNSFAGTSKTLEDWRRNTSAVAGTRAHDVILNAKGVWENSYTIQRACHFRFDVFCDVLRDSIVPNQGTHFTICGGVTTYEIF